MDIQFSNLKRNISESSNLALFELSKLLNTEILNRTKSGRLKGYFLPGYQLSFTDDDGCILFGEIASSDEFHFISDQIFIKEVDQVTKQNLVIEDDNGNYLISGVPMMNEAQVFKYVIDEKGLIDV